MNDMIGIVWFKDESAYRRALEIFTDSKSMPDTFKDWKALVGKQLEEVRRIGDIALRADFDPETFIDWCNLRGFQANSQARTAFAEHVVLEYQKTGKGTVIE
ncbi:MAG: hypothetical protein A4E64_01686 [Syntrophorhabdus sp. PtaU1.Bin058]|nr:MAG: hypothetical protein A4E64_01686 [Syntrophorhabdus sp. PtaU1.Bin058]